MLKIYTKLFHQVQSEKIQNIKLIKIIFYYLAGKTWITNLSFTGVLIKFKEESSSPISGTQSWVKDIKVAGEINVLADTRKVIGRTNLCGTLHKMKNGTYRYRNLAIGLERGNRLQLNFTVTTNSTSIIHTMSKEYQIDIGVKDPLEGMRTNENDVLQEEDVLNHVGNNVIKLSEEFSTSFVKNKIKKFADIFVKNFGESSDGATRKC